MNELRKLAAETCTPRQRAVLDLWLAGAGLRRTAVALGISISTVRTHRQALVARLGPHLDKPKTR